MTNKQIRDRIVGVLSASMMSMEQEAECVRFLDECLEDSWILVSVQPPERFVSVLGYMTDAGPFPEVRECYRTDDEHYFFPALEEVHPISHWKQMPKGPKEAAYG